MVYFVANSLGLLMALPLVIDGLFLFMHNYDTYTELRRAQYEDFIAKILPSFVYILTKKNEDCFSCFNRLHPQKYSILSFSESEIRVYGTKKR